MVVSVVNAVLRREEQANGAFTNFLPYITYKDLFINPWNREVRMQGRVVALTHTEYEILYMLASNPGVTFSKDKIYSHIWGAAGNIGTSIVRDHISALRKKLGISPNNDYIETVFGVGYRFSTAEQLF